MSETRQNSRVSSSVVDRALALRRRRLRLIEAQIGPRLLREYRSAVSALSVTALEAALTKATRRWIVASREGHEALVEARRRYLELVNGGSGTRHRTAK